MLKKLKSLLAKRQQKKNDSSVADDKQLLHLATAALLVEVTRADHEVKETEKDAMRTMLSKHFKLTDSEVKELIGLAEQDVDHATSLYQYTTLIDAQLARDEKVKVIEMLWHVAYADADKDKYEEHIIRRIADLIHLSHHDFIRARHRVEQSLGL